MRRNRSLPTLPHLLPRRVRLVKLLRAHGLRDAERLREDELLGALSRLKIVLPSTAPIAFAAPLPTSSGHSPNAAPSASAAADTEADLESLYDDPHALERFLEPKIFIPAGERTFLRLIAVDPFTLFATWDLDEHARSLVEGRVFIDLVRLDDDENTQRVFIDLLPGGWYIGAPRSGCTVVARLGCESAQGDKVIVESNAAIVLPNQPQEGGEVIFATIPPKTNRAALAGGKLLEEKAALPDGVTIEATGESATLPVSERQRVVDGAAADAPGSGERAGGEGALPSSAAYAEGAGPLPTSPGGIRAEAQR